MARILIIDDSISVLHIAADILRRAGHDVITSESGRVGVSVLTRQELDLVITDVYMPEGDGLEVLRIVRRTRPSLPVIAISAATGAYDMLAVARALGAAQVLHKPFSGGDLSDAVEACLAAASAPALSVHDA